MHLNPFHPAYMHKKWCRKIDAKRQWHGGRGGRKEGGGGRGEQVRRGKNPRQGESLDKEKDKTDSTTTNKQDP